MIWRDTDLSGSSIGICDPRSRQRQQPQLAVSEVAPGDADYSGGRWFTHTVTIEDESAYEERAPLTSEQEILEAQSDGVVEIHVGPPQNVPPNHTFFDCPLFETVKTDE